MKFAIILLGCIVATQAYYPGYNPGNQGYNPSGYGGYGASPSGFGGSPSGLMGGKTMGGKSMGLMGGKSMGLMGGKSMGLMGGKSMGLMGGKSMGLMGGKSMGLMGGKSMGGQTGFAQITCPSYQYWASHSFHCMPPKNLYCYNVQFNQAWCTTQFYADILTEYPKCVDQTCEAEKANVDVVLTDLTTKLTEARKKIETELKSHSTTFVTHIKEIHAQYLQALKLYLARCYSPDSYMYCQKVASYEAELNSARIHAIANYETSVRTIMAKIQAFHTSLVASFRSCLIKRATQMKSYFIKLEHSAATYVARYRTHLLAVLNKKVHFVTSVFNQLYDGKDKPANYAEFLEQLKKELTVKLEADLAEFRKQIESVLTQMKDSYRCNYKCLIRSNCYQFAKKSQFQQCLRFPNCPTADCKLVGVNAFKVDWHGIDVSNLKKGTGEKCVFDIQVYMDAIAVKVTQQQADLAAKIASWKTRTLTWESTAMTGLTARAESLVPEVYCDRKVTQEEIDNARRVAMIRSKNWVALKKKELLAQIEAVEKKVSAQIDAWKISAEKYVNKVKAKFDECVASKEAKIASYNELLESTKQSKRAALVAQLNHCRSVHKAAFEKFFVVAFGDKVEGLITEVKAHYLKCVDDHVAMILKKFDDWWTKYQPRLVEHHTCGLKCKAIAHVPHLHLHYTWTFKAPVLDECKFWC